MNNHSKVYYLTIVFSTLLAGCSTHYVEQITQPSRVVSPLPQSRSQVKPLTTSILDTQSIEPDHALENGFEYTESRSPSAQSYSSTRPAIYNDSQFSDNYKKARKPKIALFLYRELSQDVLDYSSNQRLVFAGQHKKDKSNLVVAKQNTYNTDQGHRHTSSTRWAWQFEDHLMNDLLSSGVKLVDRATIMRLVASKVDSSKDSTGLLSVKKIEMDALKGYADIFVEVLISPSTNRSLIYDVRLTAKEVKTGQIVATVTSMGQDFVGDELEDEVLLGNTFDKIEPKGVKKIKKKWSTEKTAHWITSSLKNKLSMYWMHK